MNSGVALERLLQKRRQMGASNFCRYVPEYICRRYENLADIYIRGITDSGNISERSKRFCNIRVRGGVTIVDTFNFLPLFLIMLSIDRMHSSGELIRSNIINSFPNKELKSSFFFKYQCSIVAAWNHMSYETLSRKMNSDRDLTTQIDRIIEMLYDINLEINGTPNDQRKSAIINNRMRYIMHMVNAIQGAKNKNIHLLRSVIRLFRGGDDDHGSPGVIVSFLKK